MQIIKKYTNLVMNNERLKALCLSVMLVSVLALLTYFVQGVIQYPDQRYSEWDYNKYIAMAQQPFSSDPLVHQAPFCWRILTSWLVHIMPMDFRISFYLITFLALCFSGYVLYFCMRALKLSSTMSGLGVVLYMLLYPITSGNLWGFYTTDPLSFVFIGLSFYFIIVGQDVLLALVTALGVANKETILVMLPVFFIFLLCRRHYSFFQSAIRTLAVMAPCLLIFLTIRLFITPFNDYGLEQIRNTLLIHLGDLSAMQFARELYAFSFGTWGIVLSLFLLRPREKFFLLTKRPDLFILILLVYAQLLLGNNIERILVIAFPVMIPIAILSLFDFSKRTGIHLRYVAAVCILIQMLNLISVNLIGAGVFIHTWLVAAVITIVAWLWAEWQLYRISKLHMTTSTISVLVAE